MENVLFSGRHVVNYDVFLVRRYTLHSKFLNFSLNSLPYDIEDNVLMPYFHAH